MNLDERIKIIMRIGKEIGGRFTARDLQCKLREKPYLKWAADINRVRAYLVIMRRKGLVDYEEKGKVGVWRIA